MKTLKTNALAKIGSTGTGCNGLNGINSNSATLEALFATWVAIVSVVGCGSRPAPVSTPASVTPQAASKPQTVVFMGDSITYNWGQTWASPDFSLYPNWSDAGIVGNDSGQMVDRFQSDVIDKHPDVVAILAGTNDVYPDWTLCGDGGNWDTCHNIAWMVQAAKLNGIRPVLATIPPWGCADPKCQLAVTADNSTSRFTRINQLNSWIKSYAAQQGIPVVDYWTALVAPDQQHYQVAMTVDGVHPSPKGYALMTPLIQEAIQ